MNFIERFIIVRVVKHVIKKAKEKKMVAMLIEMLKGRKTHVVAIVALALGILQGLGVYTLPESMWPILGALGLSSLRAGVQKAADEVKEKK